MSHVGNWCKEWSMGLNIDKCKVMHIGKLNNNNVYTMSCNDQTIPLKTTCNERDLGVMISSDLKWATHTMYAANKANRILGMLNKTFIHMSVDLLKILYTTFVRPHLEYAVAVCNPYAKADIARLEKVQHRATRLIPSLRELNYEERLTLLGITSLEQRRIRGDLIQTYKIINGLDVITWNTPYTFEQRLNVPTTRGHDHKLTRELVKNCDQRNNCFTNRVVNNWNVLPTSVVSAPSINSFKARLDVEMSKLSERYL